ncbi:hypothetical protein P3T36_004471 [Kitasatospora sp. MAP12-15]|uniref:hypothetical protein n=1 Tax=unclassified Kitasatospora TaxID=2633591 RepID=UPI002476AF7D|nr:hypothetical protein [Kitasatospora sp. MAP12-44]MDH6110898.1 hypothetical protein [Kitasatospora sp. MAP12-44]
MPKTAPARLPGSAQLRRAAARIPAPWRLPLAVLAGTQAIWLFWWAAFYPGLISFDSVMYTWQVTTGNWASDHSVLYDCFVWLALHLPGQFAVLTLLQTTAMSAVLGYACVALRGLGVRARWSAGAALAVAALPPTGTFVVFVWKDVPFTISAVLVFAAGARLLGRRFAGTLALAPGYRPGAIRFDLLMLALGLFGVGLFRNANEGMVLIAGVALLLALPGLRALLAALTAAAVLVPLAGQLWLYPAVGIKQPPADAVFALNYSDIAVAYDEAQYLFSPADTRLLAEVAPLSTWQAGGNCYSGDALTNSSAPFDRAAADRLNGQLLTLWTKVLKTRPDIVISARICRAHIAWSPFSDFAQNGASTVISPLDRSPDLWGWTAPAATADLSAGHTAPNGKMVGSPYLPALSSHPLSTTLHKAGVWLQTASKVNQLDWLLWRGATWCYLTYAALVLYAAGRRRRAVYALGGILVGLQLTLIAANPAELFRYNVVPLFVGPLCLGLIAARREALGTARAAQPQREEPETVSV